MLSATRSRAARSFTVLTTSLVLATTSIVGLASTASAAPVALASISVVCEYKVPNLQTSNYSMRADYSVDAEYKGRWVSFTVDAMFAGAPDDKPTVWESKWDSNVRWPAPGLTSSSTITSSELPQDPPSATIEVQVRDNKDRTVDTFRETVTCTPASA